jgi:phospholipid N-methyltransferase
METMGRRLSDGRLFFKEFRAHFRTTGAVLPSGRRLAWALTRFVRQHNGQPRRILEVGPGTGAVTAHLIAAMGPADRLDVVELNASFVERLRQRFQTDPAFQAVASRGRVLHCPVEELPLETTYDLLISGLPLNNFSVEEVQHILEVLGRLATAGGILSFFEYVGIRRLKAAVSGPAERRRLRGIETVVGQLLDRYEVRRDWVVPNVPPAWVHHVRFPGGGGGAQDAIAPCPLS